MALDLVLFSKKLRTYRNQFKLEFNSLSNWTGISVHRLRGFENSTMEPTGDEILIIADVFKCDFKYFISNEKLEPVDETDTLYRKYENDFNVSDRWAIQELLYLAECEAYLQKVLGQNSFLEFNFIPEGTFYKEHALEASIKLRETLKLKGKEIPRDVFRDFRKLGIHIFRRKLDNSKISGLFVNHPTAGKCILVNYTEDIFRQRYSVCHEVAHCIFDSEKEALVTFSRWAEKDLIEIRAESFASYFLVPPSIFKNYPVNELQHEKEVISLSSQLKVSTSALANSLYKNNFINKELKEFIRSVRIPKELKIDPELSGDISPNGIIRKKSLLERGLSSYYVNLCFNAYNAGLVSASRISEMLLIPEKELREVFNIYGEKIEYGN